MRASWTSRSQIGGRTRRGPCWSVRSKVHFDATVEPTEGTSLWPVSLFRPGLLWLIADLLCLNLGQHVVVLLPLDDVLQVNPAVLVLQVKVPSRDLVDIGPMYRLLVANYAMKACLREFPCAVTLMIFQFSQRFKKSDLQLRRKRPSQLGRSLPRHRGECWCEPTIKTYRSFRSGYDIGRWQRIDTLDPVRCGGPLERELSEFGRRRILVNRNNEP
jgi:hypothetical protein